MSTPELDFERVHLEIMQHLKSEIEPKLPNDYEISTIIGEGAIGAVYTARNKENGNFLAVKIVRSMINEKLRKRIREEFRIQKNLFHRNIVEVYGIINTNSFIGIFMECLTRGDLFDMIPIGSGINTGKGFTIYKQLLDAVEHCHNHKIAHMDIKPENVMISGSGVPKLTDFGLAVDHSRTASIKGRLGTTAYCAPETFLDCEYTGYKADLFSLTVTFLTAVTGERFWNRASFEDYHYCDWQDKQWTSSTIQRLPVDMMHFLIEALAHDPSHRLSIERIKDHIWYRQGLIGKITNVKIQTDFQSSINDVAVVPKSQPMLLKDHHLNTSIEANNFDGDFPLSQPINFAELLMPPSNNDTSSSSSSSIVKRMTRFFSTLNINETIDRVRSIIEQHQHCTINRCGNNFIYVTSIVSGFDVNFRIFIYRFVDSILVDFRRARGDGLLFHTVFTEVFKIAKQLEFVNESHPYLKLVLPI